MLSRYSQLSELHILAVTAFSLSCNLQNFRLFTDDPKHAVTARHSPGMTKQQECDENHYQR